MCNSKRNIVNEFLWAVFERSTNTFFVPIRTESVSFSYFLLYFSSAFRLHSVDHIIELCDNVHPNIDSNMQLNAQKQNIRDEAQRIQTESERLAIRSVV